MEDIWTSFEIDPLALCYHELGKQNYDLGVAFLRLTRSNSRNVPDAPGSVCFYWPVSAGDEMCCSVVEFVLCAPLSVTNRSVSDHGVQQHDQAAEFRHFRIDVLQNHCGYCSAWIPKKKTHVPRQTSLRTRTEVSCHVCGCLLDASSHTPPCVSPRNSDCHDKEQAQPWRVFHELDQAASFNECSERFCVIQEQNRMVHEISKKLLSHSEPGHKFELKASVQMRMSAPEMYCASATCWRKLAHTSMRPS